MSNDKEKEKKKITWITDDMIEDNKIIVMPIQSNDPRGFLHTDKTPKEIDAIIKRYMEKSKTKVFMISTEDNKIMSTEENQEEKTYEPFMGAKINLTKKSEQEENENSTEQEQQQEGEQPVNESN